MFPDIEEYLGIAEGHGVLLRNLPCVKGVVAVAFIYACPVSFGYFQETLLI